MCRLLLNRALPLSNNQKEGAMRRLAILAILVVLAVSSEAQTVVMDQIILLRNDSTGLYLSAEPRQKVSLSPNTAGWEQWQIRQLPVWNSGNGPGLASFHGTGLIQEQDDSVVHVPVRSGVDGGIYLKPLQKAPDGIRWYVTEGQLAIGSKVSLRGRNLFLSVDNGQIRRDTTLEVYPNGVWTIVAAPTAGAGRSPLLLAVSARILLPNRVSGAADRVYLRSGSSGNVSPRYLHVGSDYYAYHLPLKKFSFLPERDFTPELMSFNNPIRFFSPDYSRYVGARSDGPIIEVPRAAGIDWIPIDPTGRYRAGDRVPFGYGFCLRTLDGKMGMSADPGVAKLSMSPNCAAWEMWFLEK
jgi:hypothetical protein